MSNIVTPLVNRLSWSAWLKPFFIHPSVTEGAANNMISVRYAQQRIADKKQETADRAKYNTVLEAINAIVNPAEAVDFGDDEALKGLIGKIQRSLHDLLPTKAAPAEEGEELEASTVSHSTNKPGLDQMKFDLEQFFLEALALKDAARRAALLKAFETLSPQHKAVMDMIAVVEKLTNEDAKQWFDTLLTKDMGYSNRGTSTFEKRLTYIYTSTQHALDHEAESADLAAFNTARELLNPETRNPKPAQVNPRKVFPYVKGESLGTLFKGAFWRAVGFHGYDPVSTELTTAHGEKFYFQGSNFWHTLAALMGLPTRVDSKRRYSESVAVYTWRQFVRDLFGGWESVYGEDAVDKGRWFATSRFWWLNPRNYDLDGKRLWNLVLLLTGVKLVIAAYYIVTFPVKLALNIVRQVTEVLPQVLLQYSGQWYGAAASNFLGLYYDEHQPGKKKAIAYLVSALILAISFPVHHIARLWLLAGTAATSPQQSAREAWKYGLAVDSPFRIVFATVGALSSLALTAVIWALTFPVLFAKALVLFPALAPVVTSIAQLPIVANTLQVIGGTASLVAGTLPAAFSAAATAISAAFGVTVSATTLAVAVTWAVIAAPVAAVTTAIANGLANVWTRWNPEWTLVEAASQAAADVVVRTATFTTNLLPSDDASKLTARLEEAHWGTSETAELLDTREHELNRGSFSAYPRNLDVLRFPEPADSSHKSGVLSFGGHYSDY